MSGAGAARLARPVPGLRYAAAQAEAAGVSAPKALATLGGLALGRADTYALTDEIGELVAAGAATIPHYELRAEDVPSAGGLVVFEAPCVFMDTSDKALAVKALLWHTSRVAVSDEAVPAVGVSEDGSAFRRRG